MIFSLNNGFHQIKLKGIVKFLTFKFVCSVLSSFLFFFSTSNMSLAQGSDLKFARAELSIQTSTAVYDFQIELAENDTQRAYGLMFRNSLPEQNGMLFIYDQKRSINMWMKNTFIFLDIVFIDDDGKIMKIARSAQPQSLSRISSGGEAKAVLELNGGETERLGIDVGDTIIYPLFQNAAK